MKQQIENLIKESLKKLDIEVDSVFVEHPIDFKMGDFSTNIALSQAKKQNINPKELADKIVAQLESDPVDYISKVEVAGPGFINFYLSREFFTNSVKEILEKGDDWGKNDLLVGKKIMVEYTDPNPFKPFHIGHLMTNAIGESISRIVEFSSAKVVRANYQGDIGPHVAKAIYGLIKYGMPDESKSISEQAQYIGECYSKGSNLYDTDEEVKKEINEINKKIYDKSDEKINNIYDWGRRVTLEAFEEIYKILGTKFEYYFFESDMAPVGEKVVKENIGKAVSAEDTRSIFEESDGAVVFHGENYDKKLHTRVFINSQSLPTYETKEIGLTMTKFEKENPDTSIVITAIEQAEYMKVVQKAISLIHPDFESRMKHITHGMMRFASGKMSSRKGNVVTGESLLRDSMDVVLEKVKDREFKDEEKKNISKIVGVSALKYSILRSSLGSDIIYDFEKSISFEGDSGPYLQYTAVRASSILNKANELNLENKNFNSENDLEVTELEKTLYKFPEIVENSNILFEPHHIATYLTELAGAFNNFYGNTKILNEENINITYHLSLVKAFYQTMKNGLYLLGIETPEKM
jgi:arginyl-tRNA synthetase